MKEIWSFIKWHWDKWSFGQRVYIIGGFFVGMGFKGFMETGIPPVTMQIGFAIWCLILLKWFVIDQIVESWNRFKKEKAELFNTIKEGK